MKKEFSFIKEVRGKGFLLALELDRPARPVLDKCLDKGLLINVVQEKVLRILPPLIVKKKHVDEALSIMREVFKGL